MGRDWNVNDPDAVFAQAQARLAADEAAAKIEPSQRDHPAADRLLRRFAERMRGTERTKIIVGHAPMKTFREKTGLFRTRTYEGEPVAERPFVMGWAFLTGFNATPWYHTVRHGDPDSRTPTYNTYSVLAVDTNGQLYLATSTTEPPKKMGIFEVPVVTAFDGDVGHSFSDRTRKWNGVGNWALGWCGYYSPTSPRPGSSISRYHEYERMLADYNQKADQVDQFLAPGLGAALSATGR
jgi:hypothetical protein